MKPDGNEVELNKEVSDTIDYYNRELKENGDDGHLEWTHDKRKKVVQLFYVYNL